MMNKKDIIMRYVYKHTTQNQRRYIERHILRRDMTIPHIARCGVIHLEATKVYANMLQTRNYDWVYEQFNF